MLLRHNNLSKLVGTLFFWTGIWTTVMRAQDIHLIPTDPNQSIEDRAWIAFQRGKFTEVESLAQKVLTDTSINDTIRAKVLFALGCAEAMRGKTASALLAFKQALISHPQLNPDPDQIPPPALNIFNLSRTLQPLYTNERSSPVYEANHSNMRYFYQPTSVLKSFLLPGWGHLSEGRREGKWWLSAQTLSGLVWFTLYLKTKSARDEYLKEEQRSQIEDKYRRYNRLYQAQWGVGITAIGIYISAQIHFYIIKKSADRRYLKED